MSFGERLRLARLSKGLTQEQLAHELDLSQGAVGRWELSGGFPEVPKLISISGILGVTVDWLLAIDESNLLDHIENRKSMTAMALVKRLSEVLENENLTESQISLIFNMINEFANPNKKTDNKMNS